MTFEEIYNQTLDMLERQGKVSYRALKRQFGIDDAYLEDLKFEIVEVHRRAMDQDGVMLVLTADAPDAQAEEAVVATNRLGVRSAAGLGAQPAAGTISAPNPQPAITTSLFVQPVQAVAVVETRTPVSAEGERRQLTVMFCDLVGSTALSETLDPEDLREILNSYHDFTQKAIASYDGYIAKYMGDGLLIYFGYPQAHEDDAVRAVRSGLRILEAVTAASAQFVVRWGVSLGVRLGVHTGLVVAGEMGVGTIRETRAIVGETPNVAARLQGLAETNTLFISAATRRLVAGYFECEARGSHQLKGISDPVPVYQVLRENAARSRFDVAVEATLTPLTGREQEWQFLKSHWEQAREGYTQTVLICGEAGIGKSRLVWETKRLIAQEEGAWLTECSASQYHLNSAFYPIIELLERVMHFDRQDSADEKLVKTESFLMQYGLPLPEHLPLFAALLSLPFEHKYARLPFSPEQLYQKTIADLAAILRRRAAQQPVLFVVEDLHWLDVSSLDLLNHLLNLEPTARLMMLFTSRPEFTPPWGAHSQCSVLDLKNLPQEQTEEIITGMAGGTGLPVEVVRQIAQKADGIPLYIEEITKSVLEASQLTGGSGHHEISGSLSAVAIPFSLQDSLVARLDRLAVVKEIAQLGATLARQFDYELIAAVSTWSETELLNALEQLVNAELLYQHGTPPKATYKFKHALIQDAAYESLLKSRRLQYHLRIAQVLEERFPDIVMAQPEQLAHHYGFAGVATHAIPYWIKAGQQALSRAANLDALTHFTRGLETLSALPVGEERDRHELEMHLGVGPAHMAIRGWACVEVEETCRRARDLSIQLNDPQKLTFALWGLWSNYLLRGHHQYEYGLKTAEDVLRLAHQSKNQMLLVAGYHAVGYTHFFRGEYTLSLQYSESALAEFDLERERIQTAALQMSSTCTILLFRSETLWALGYPEQASESLTRCLTLDEQLNHAPTHLLMLASSCFYYQMLRDVDQVKEISQQVLEVSKAAGHMMWSAIGAIYHGWAVGMTATTPETERMMAQRATGLAELTEGISQFRATGTGVTMPQILFMLGELYHLTNRTSEALAAVEEGLLWAERQQEHHLEPELYRLKGVIQSEQSMLDQPDQDAVANLRFTIEFAVEAEVDFKQALQKAQQQEAKSLVLRATVSYGRFLAAKGRREEAHTGLAAISQEFTEGWNTPELIEAQNLLHEWA